MNTFTLGACFQHELHTGPYFMTFAPRQSGKKGKTKLQKHKGALFFDSVPQAISTDFLDALHFFHRYFTQLI